MGILGPDPQRPPTSCAHRLRKPDRTCELLATYVARWALDRGLSPMVFEDPEGWLPYRHAPCEDATVGNLPPRQIRRCRRRFRTTTTGRTRPPSIGSLHALRRGWVGPARCSLARPHPAPCCSPRAMPPIGTEAPLDCAAEPRSKAGGSLRAIPRSSHVSMPSPAPGHAQRARKMRLTDFCNRLPSRALPDCPIPGCTPCLARLSTCRSTCTGPSWAEAPLATDWDPPLACRMSLPGGASLDGEPPASTTLAQRARRVACATCRARGIARSWWSHDRRLLRAVPLVAALFAPGRAGNHRL
jgi:hypothetical protein